MNPKPPVSTDVNPGATHTGRGGAREGIASVTWQVTVEEARASLRRGVRTRWAAQQFRHMCECVLRGSEGHECVSWYLQTNSKDLVR